MPTYFTQYQILKEAEKVFFEAMIDGYAGGENRRSVTIKEEGGYTATIYHTEDGRFKVMDRYCTNPLSDGSAGTTTIFYRFENKWIAVWWMSYAGGYTKEAIKFLKSALKECYSKKEFKGGRGPKSFFGAISGNGLSFEVVYKNKFKGTFQKFQGEEKIFQKGFENGTPNGFHKYFGMSLI